MTKEIIPVSVTKELIPLKRNIALIANEASKFKIVKKEDMKTATELLSTLNKYADSVIDKKKTITNPLNEALKNVRTMFKPLEDTYEEAISILRNKMSVWQTEQIKLQREEAAKIAARVAPGKGNLSIETAVKKIEELDKPEDNIATEVGDVKFREVKRFRVIQAGLVPDQYWKIDEDAIKEAMKNGVEIAGVEYYTEQVPVNYR